MVTLPPDVAALYPFESCWLDTPEGRLHYVDEGPRDAPVLVCVHGNPTWSFYWRAFIDHFRRDHRVLALDHMGCGLSDKPQSGFDYRLASHVHNLRQLLDATGVEKASFAVHDWGGAIGMGVATAQPERVERLIVTNTAAFRSERIPASIASVRIPGFGALAVRGFNAFAQAAVLRATEKGLAPVVKKGLLLPYNSWAHRIATLRFVEDIPMKPSHPSWPTLVGIEEGLVRLRDKAMLLVWGDADWCFGPWFRKEWMRRFPEARVHALPEAGHYVLEDAPESVLDVSRAFLDARSSV